jgi:hypothetical protein
VAAASSSLSRQKSSTCGFSTISPLIFATWRVQNFLLPWIWQVMDTVRCSALMTSLPLTREQDTGWAASTSRLDKAGRQHVLVADGDIPTLGETTGGHRVQRQEMRGEGTGIDDFDHAGPGGALHLTVSEPVFAYHQWFLHIAAVEGQTSDGFGVSSVAGDAHRLCPCLPGSCSCSPRLQSRLCVPLIHGLGGTQDRGEPPHGGQARYGDRCCRCLAGCLRGEQAG